MELTMANRTADGSPSSAARDEYGSGKSGKAFPVFDHTSAMDALRLRGHSANLSRSAVENKVESYADSHGDAAAKKAVAAARLEDKSQ
jgi:hypothetical protein